MFFQQFYLESLGHASYLLGDEETGRGLVFDPRRDVEPYLQAARANGFRIAYAMDSHGHNDYLSGVAELAGRVGGLEVLGSGYGDLGYPHRPVRDGEAVELGEVGVEVLHTPGHTPEHVSLLVYDRSASAEVPALLLSGGALLVGDLARPDLLGGPEQARRAAEVFCRTIQAKLLALPDHVEVFPTHVKGSLCGGNIGSRLSTTVGFEKRANAVLAEVASTDEFVGECLRLDNLPAVPPYWRRMRSQNLAGVERLGVLPEPAAMTADEFDERRQAEAIVLDARAPEAFGGGHVPGALNVGLGPAFATWAGTILPAGAEVLLVLDGPADLWEATWQLLRIGYPVPAGWLAGGMTAWRTTARPVEGIPQISVHDLRPALHARDVGLLDVRQPAEWADEHIPGAVFVTGAELPDRLDEVSDDRPVAVICSSGYRSSVAASLLARDRKTSVLNVLGGMTAWTQAGYPTTTD
jgi:hydroxyacylglutathione hydrolase